MLKFNIQIFVLRPKHQEILQAKDKNRPLERSRGKRLAAQTPNLQEYSAQV